MKHIFLLPSIIVVMLIGILFLAVHITRETRDYDCLDFDTYQDALNKFEQYDTDIYHLDGDSNRIPCEMLINK